MFNPDQRRDILDLLCHAFGLDDEAGLPAYLKEEIAIPLRIGSAEVLELRYNVPSEHKEHPRTIAFRRAMFRYARSRAYQHAILNCETRFTIDMEPAEPITDDARQHAISNLREMNKRRQDRQEREERARMQAAEARPETASHPPAQPAAEDAGNQERAE